MNARTLLATVAVCAIATTAQAVEPVGSDSFNVDTPFDLSGLTAENFYDVVVPAAQAEGSVIFFDFTNSFGPLFSERLIPAFEEEYGITVDYVRGNGDAAAQQLMAAMNAGADAPADLYFMGAGMQRTLENAGAMANLPLYRILPSAATVDETLATMTEGHNHGGIYLPFHRNQTSIVYNTRFIDEGTAPTNFEELLAWAQANEGRFVLTSPSGGGSGSGFLQSVMLDMIEGDECRATLANYGISQEEAEAFAASDCLQPVWDYYNALLPVVELSTGNSDTLTLIANGAGYIGTAWEDMAYDFMGRGLLPPTTRQYLLEEGQVGGGDGLFLPAEGTAPAAALLMMDFFMSADIQLEKLQVNGSRTARTDIDPSAVFSPEEAARLIPTSQFAERARVNVPRPINNATRDYFDATVLAGN